MKKDKKKEDEERKKQLEELQRKLNKNLDLKILNASGELSKDRHPQDSKPSSVNLLDGLLPKIRVASAKDRPQDPSGIC